MAAELAQIEASQSQFEIYEDGGNKHRWRLHHRNRQILADSGQGYASRTGAEDGINSVKQNAPNADVAGK